MKMEIGLGHLNLFLEILSSRLPSVNLCLSVGFGVLDIWSDLPLELNGKII